MNGRNVLVMAGILAVWMSTPMAMASKDRTNKYFTNDGSNMLILKDSDTANGTTLIERTTTSPVMIETSSSPPVVIEDRIVKKKHAFKLGIWPLFDFEVL
jgi:hypothetical protein